MGVGVKTTLVVAPALKSPTVQQYAECVSVGTIAFVRVAVCCSVLVPTPSEPRHTHTPMPAWPVEMVEDTALELPEAATAVQTFMAQVFAAAFDWLAVNVRPVAVGVPIVAAPSAVTMHTITSPVSHDTDALLIVLSDVEYATSVYEINDGAVARAT